MWQIIQQIFQTVFFTPIVNLLAALYILFDFLRLPGPLGFAVIGLTIVIRLILYPLTLAQLKSAKKMTDLKPHLDLLSKKHKDDKQALQQAQMALYKDHGINPAAGCLPILIQFPVLIALYNVFYQVLNNGNLDKAIEAINSVVYHPALKIVSLDLSFFGINLGVKPSQWATQGWWLLSIPVITGLLQWYQTKLMLPGQTAVINSQPLDKKLIKPENNKQNAQPEDTAMEMQRQMAIISPIMFGFFAYQFPLGLALYWNVFGLFGIIQQLQVNKIKK